MPFGVSGGRDNKKAAPACFPDAVLDGNRRWMIAHPAETAKTPGGNIAGNECNSSAKERPISTIAIPAVIFIGRKIVTSTGTSHRFKVRTPGLEVRSLTFA